MNRKMVVIGGPGIGDANWPLVHTDGKTGMSALACGLIPPPQTPGFPHCCFSVECSVSRRFAGRTAEQSVRRSDDRGQVAFGLIGSASLWIVAPCPPPVRGIEGSESNLGIPAVRGISTSPEGFHDVPAHAHQIPACQRPCFPR